MLSAAILRKTKGFTQQKSLQHAAVLFSGRAGVQLIGLLSQPVLARLYSPAHFGEFAFLNSILAILLVASSGRYEAGIVLSRRPGHAKRLFQLAQLVLLGYVLLLTLGVFVAPPMLLNYFEKQGFSLSYLWLIPLLVLSTGYWEIVYNWLVRFQKYSQISISLITQRLLIFGGALVAIVLPIPGNGLIFGLLVGSLGIFITAFFLQKEPLRIPLKGFKSYAHHFREFPSFSVPTLGLSLFIQHLPILCLGYFFGSKAAGEYSMAFTFCMVPLSCLSMSAGKILYERLAQSKTEQQDAILKKVCMLYTIILLPIAILLFFRGEPLTVFLLGRNWQEAGKITSAIAPLMLVQGLLGCFMTALTVYRKQKTGLMLQTGRLIMWCVCLWVGILKQDVILSLKLVSMLSVLHLILTASIVRTITKSRIDSHSNRALAVR